MTPVVKPPQIVAILKAIAAAYPADIGASLEAYITELQARQPERPAQIDAILKTIEVEHPLDMGMLLNAYIADLEARQQAIVPVMKPADAADNPPIWSHVHVARREQRRRARKLQQQAYDRQILGPAIKV